MPFIKDVINQRGGDNITRGGVPKDNFIYKAYSVSKVISYCGGPEGVSKKAKKMMRCFMNGP